jgi:hypothetical protein
MIEAARKYGVFVQVGLNNRSSRNVRDAIEFLHGGGIGEMYLARALVFKARDSYGQSKDGTPPAQFHYDRWLGPAPDRPYNEKRSHYNWHWYWDTGNGDTGNTGPHHARHRALGPRQERASRVGVFGRADSTVSAGRRRPGKQDQGHAGVRRRRDLRARPDLPGNAEHADRRLHVRRRHDARAGHARTLHEPRGQQGPGGRQLCFLAPTAGSRLGGSTWKAFRKRGKEPVAGSKDGERTGSHWANFLEALRAGKSEALHCDIHEGHLSTSLCHLANISYRVGRSLKFMSEHERFANDAEANAHLTRIYRQPYTVPEKV